jgi:hypothetical protein
MARRKPHPNRAKLKAQLKDVAVAADLTNLVDMSYRKRTHAPETYCDPNMVVTLCNPGRYTPATGKGKRMLDRTLGPKGGNPHRLVLTADCYATGSRLLPKCNTTR